MQSPPIDQRKLADIVAETEDLAQSYSGWRPPPDGAPDAGQALIRIFGRFAEIIIGRLNRAPEKNFLAFLNLIGTELLPPQPARVPLTFQLAANSPVDAVVPAGTRAAAPPMEGEEDEVIFETERDLVVTRARLQAVFVHDTDADRYAERTAEAAGDLDEPFAAFQGDREVAHELYLACEAVLPQPGEKDVTLIVRSPDTWQWASWPFQWSYSDGKTWQTVTPVKNEINQGAWRVTFSRLPPLKPQTVSGVEAGWLRARLTLPLPPEASGLLPESVAHGNDNPGDLVLPYAAFGDTASVTTFYLSADRVFGVGGAVAQLQIALARPGQTSGLKLKWSYLKTAGVWAELGQSGSGAASSGATEFGFTDDSRALTKDGLVTFRVPRDWERVLHGTRTGRWLRVEIVDGGYSSRPRLSALSVGYDWQLPRISSIQVARQTKPVPLAPELAFFNGNPIDLSKDFYPFGEQPRYNDALYLACEKALARPGNTVTFTMTLTNPVGATSPTGSAVTTEGSPTVGWEVWDGTAWVRLETKNIAKDTKPGTPYTLTGSGEVKITLPPTLALVAVNGVEKHWLRARLIGGHYGEAADYVPGTIEVSGAQIPSYTPKPATYAPPVIQSIAFADITAGAAEIPVSNFLSNNGEVYVDHTVAAATGAGTAFPPFTPTAETGRALYLGFDQPFEPRPMTLYLQVEAPEPHEVAAEHLAELDPGSSVRVTWEHASPSGWKPLGALDGTQSFARRELLQFIGPKDFARRPLFGQDLYWLRAHWERGEFPLLPRLRRVLPNTTWATEVTTCREENLGSSNGNAGQVFRTAQVPVLPGQVLEVREPELPTLAEREDLERLDGPDGLRVILDAAGQPEEIWVRWRAVADFYESGPRDRHYTLDALNGEIRFGDGRYGMIPPVSQNNLRITYRSGGGKAGNRAAGTIVQLKSTVPFVDGVTQHESAGGGTERESIEQVSERGPRWLRHRNRSVTAQDLEDLAFEADRNVARARAVVPTFHPHNLWLDPKDPNPAKLDEHEAVNAGRIGVIVVPRSEASRPTPSLSLLRRVQSYVATRCPVSADLWVAGPEWVEVTVSATVVPASLDVAEILSTGVAAALDCFLHPLTGGPDRQGWTFGRRPHRSDLYAVIEGIKGVDHVRTLTVTSEPQIVPKGSEDQQLRDEQLRIAIRNYLNQPLMQTFGKLPDRGVQRWLHRSLVYAGQHDIRLSLERT